MQITDRNKYDSFICEIQMLNDLNVPLREKFIRLKQILERICKDITDQEVLQFPSLFSRIVYISQIYKLPKSLESQLHKIRVKATFLLKDEKNIIKESLSVNSFKSVNDLISIIYLGDRVGESVDKQVDTTSPISAKMRVQVTNINREEECLTCHSDTGAELIVQYNVEKINKEFNSTINKLWLGAQVNIIDSIVDKETGCIVPKYIVLEPDYLIDASALAECFQNYGRSHLHYFRRKFEPNTNSKHILLGDLANYFLDELVYSEQSDSLKFQDVFVDAFKNSPFEFTSCNDIKNVSDFRLFMSKAKTQFENIKRVVKHDFKANNIDTKQCTLEPSFYCEKFGFQGRLDLLQIPEKENDTLKIIELKSGGLPYPKEDNGKIALNHEAQTTIYRLMIQSVFNKQARDVSASILYSVSENQGENLRFSAAYKAFEKEIINIRNLIIATEHDLYLGDEDAVASVFKQLFDLNNYGLRIPQFFIDKLVDIDKVLQAVTELERAYLYRFISFLSRELYIQKIGGESYDSNSSTSALWNTEFNERQESFDLIAELQISDIEDSDNDMKVLFKRSTNSNFVNFRKGEICIVYPKDNESNGVLTNQIMKGTIAEIDHEHVLVRFRYKQKNKKYLYNYKHWVIEHDKLDHSYTAMFKSLYTFLSAPTHKRSLLLGLEYPVSTFDIQVTNKSKYSIKEKQEIVIAKALAAKDYFLIVGPPGTGKTSIFARRLIESLHANPQTNILVMAYTNRAVDELCDAINGAFSCLGGVCEEYIRIGTELSCNDSYRHRLLQNIAKDVSSRDELRSIMEQKRIYVGTLASITGKLDLFDIKKFDVAIIDEASQILEPQIIGILPKFEKFILIGDHKQLSTITLQSKTKSKVDDPLLHSIELRDCREAYFERLYRVCKKNNWHQAFDTLTFQGRMHEKISAFPNKWFYNNKLQIIDAFQSQDLNLKIADINNPFQRLICEHRIAFLSATKIDLESTSDKINRHEAQIVRSLVSAIFETYQANGLKFDKEKSLGIITPYRNQIALIKHELDLLNIPDLQGIMIDTVERFQGSQRDIIILSFCMNKPYQLDFFSNMTKDGTVDRKLNVAMTRARQQLFLVGNDTILRENYIYKSLLEEIPIF